MSILGNLLIILIFLISITLHEWGHAYMAYKCGDPTPQQQGRLSFNPLKHIDLLGLIALIVFGIGWAKPVQFNPQFFQKPKECIVKITLMGPFMNFIQVVFFAIVGYLFPNGLILLISKLGVIVNLFLGLFNLLPFWPLDGFNALMFLASDKDRLLFWNTRYVSFIIFLILLITGLVDSILNFIVAHFFSFLL